MIFISGVHGVGKAYFCNIVKEKLSIETYSASALIAEKKKSGFAADKLIPDIDENQQYLLAAVEELRSAGTDFIIDGHFCLLNAQGIVTRIPEETFTTLHPDAIVLLTENPSVIASRRQDRDHIEHLESDIKAFQEEEIKYATEVADLLCVPLKVSNGSGDIEGIVEFIRTRRM